MGIWDVSSVTVGLFYLHRHDGSLMDVDRARSR
jgi:hypothetical protein